MSRRRPRPDCESGCGAASSWGAATATAKMKSEFDAKLKEQTERQAELLGALRTELQRKHDAETATLKKELKD